jgi:hypothetical protein
MPRHDRGGKFVNIEDEDQLCDLDPEYEAELFHRLEEIESGRAKLLSLDEVMTRLRRPQPNSRASSPPR